MAAERSELKSLQSELPPPDPTEPPPGAHASEPSFVMEAFVSSGPRKSRQDYDNGVHELCEDSAGLIHRAVGSCQQYIWWLCDGTSQGPSLSTSGVSDMSTRLLARDLGDCFVKIMLYYKGVFQPNQWSLLGQGMEYTWGLKYREFIDALAVNGRLDDLYKVCAEDADGYVLKWSSTFIGGVAGWSKDYQSHLDVMQAGDSGGVVCLRQDGKLRAWPLLPTVARVILQIKIPPQCPRDATIRVIVPPSGTGLHRFEDIEGFAVMSDGAIRTDFSRFLSAVAQKCSATPFRDVRDGLVSRTDRSYDDKSMVIGWLMDG